ncbi:MAG TPA: Tex family protein [Longimicrobiales bacterium]|nr:Tex family protein [Longimicrobiales bacterium]
MLDEQLIDRLATELNIAPRQARAALALFAEGATVPFVARYRKEVTGGLDDLQLRTLEDRATYLEELEERRAAILASIDEQGKLDAALRARIEAAETKQALEDLYLPYKPKRRTRATIARERGLEPLADLIWSGVTTDAEALAAAAEYVNPEREVATVDDALRGARDILAERMAEDADMRGFVRAYTYRHGTVVSRGKKGIDKTTSKFADYFEFSQRLSDIPSHRILAIRRGEAEEQLTWQIDTPDTELVAELQRRISRNRKAHDQLKLVAEDAYKRLLAPSIEVELRLELKQRADEDAITIFGSNLEQLLLGAPAGERVVLGLDPGYRTGVKAAVVSRTGSLITTATLYLHQEDRFREQVRALIAHHDVELIAIGNGTASRETETLVRDVARGVENAPQVVVVNEAGASVYSASDVARAEFPELDVSLRGAPSIARRLQDPLAELVKIDPKSIGVGQYQHDVNQSRLKKRLDDVVETCVNRVGVEVNTASASLLSHVAGLGPMLARNIVDARDHRGGFKSRIELMDVPRLGAKAFEQAAGFLRVRGATHPLDATAVHPERYGVVEKMARDLGVDVKALIAQDALIDRIELQRYITDEIGLPTLQDIIGELRKPGRDPRATFEPPQYRADVKEPKDLQPGMQLEGVVTNLVAFGAFVDIGVHQDGLVHVSQLADRFVKDPAEIVRVGQKVNVTVLSVDLERNRIALSMRQQLPQAAVAPNQKVEKKREPKASVPTKGTIAPNGMRFS